MQTAQAQQPFTNGNIKQLSSFELITNWIDTGYTLELTPTAMQLMTVLLRFYNPSKKYVFPHQGTLAERTNTSLSTVKRSLNELIQAQLIIKTRTQRGNVYGFTSKLFDLLNGSNLTIPMGQNEPSMNRTDKRINKRTTTGPKKAEEAKKKREVVISFNSFSLARIPASILVRKTDKNGKPIRSHAAYWNSFTDEQKREYLKIEAEEAEKLKKREALKKQQEQEEAKKKAEAEKIKNEPPFYMAYTFEQAKEFCLNYVTSPVTSRLANKPNSMGAIVARMHGIDLQQLRAEAIKQS